jgi:hypothetical protein
VERFPRLTLTLLPLIWRRPHPPLRSHGKHRRRPHVGAPHAGGPACRRPHAGAPMPADPMPRTPCRGPHAADPTPRTPMSADPHVGSPVSPARPASPSVPTGIKIHLPVTLSVVFADYVTRPWITPGAPPRKSHPPHTAPSAQSPPAPGWRDDGDGMGPGRGSVCAAARHTTSLTRLAGLGAG